MLSLFDKFKIDHFRGPSLKASGGITKFSIHFYSNEQLLRIWGFFQILNFEKVINYCSKLFVPKSLTMLKEKIS